MTNEVKKRLIELFLIFVLVFFALEITLRIQQRLGPLTDLEMVKVDLDFLSDIINHKCCNEGYFLFHKSDWVERTYDKNGIRINRLQPDCAGDCRAFKILFLGDSFMEGLDDAYTIPNCARQYLQRAYKDHATFIALNAGCTSYSPTIYIPQAKILIPLLKPDFVVVAIDETDMGNDFFDYKRLIVRDVEGNNIAVRRSPPFHAFLSGLYRIKKHPLYLIRFIRKIYHTRLYIPAFTDIYYRNDSRDELRFSRDKNASLEKYAEEITFFENNLEELAETLINLMGDKGRIFFISHPHLQHLKPDSTGFYWNNFVSESVAKVCQNYGVAFYSLAQDLKDKSEGDSQRYYILEDMHFNRYGIKVYGELVAVKILPMIEPFVEAKWPR